jgi:methionyl-tRNA synthetase
MMYASSHVPVIGAFFLPFIVAAVLWTLVLKGFALWHSARAGQKWWFVALLVINTVGILEIVYLVWFRPKSTELSVSESK